MAERARIRNSIFRTLERLDDNLHGRGFFVRPLCRLVGRLEPGYYNRTTDWAHPIFVRPAPRWTPESRKRANKSLVEAFLQLWDTDQDQRFGQLVMNLSREPGGFADTWEWNHGQWLERIGEYYARTTSASPDPSRVDESGQ